MTNSDRMRPAPRPDRRCADACFRPPRPSPSARRAPALPEARPICKHRRRAAIHSQPYVYPQYEPQAATPLWRQPCYSLDDCDRKAFDEFGDARPHGPWRRSGASRRTGQFLRLGRLRRVETDVAVVGCPRRFRWCALQARSHIAHSAIYASITKRGCTRRTPQIGVTKSIPHAWAKQTSFLCGPRCDVCSSFCSRAPRSEQACPRGPIPPPRRYTAYHDHPDRSGNFIVPSLTWDRARALHLDEGFRPQIVRACLRTAAVLACARIGCGDPGCGERRQCRAGDRRRYGNRSLETFPRQARGPVIAALRRHRSAGRYGHADHRRGDRGRLSRRRRRRPLGPAAPCFRIVAEGRFGLAGLACRRRRGAQGKRPGVLAGRSEPARSFGDTRWRGLRAFRRSLRRLRRVSWLRRGHFACRTADGQELGDARARRRRLGAGRRQHGWEVAIRRDGQHVRRRDMERRRGDRAARPRSASIR